MLKIDKNELNDHVYYNMSLTNNTTGLIPINLKDFRTEPILYNPSEYYVSVIRFFIPGTSIPLFYFTPNYYSITLTYLGNNYRQFLTYVPLSSDPELPVFTYQQFIDMINVAFRNAYIALNTAHPGVAPSEPYIHYNVSNRIFSLIAATQYNTAPIQIWMNSPLFDFFDNWQSIFAGWNQPDGKDFNILFKFEGDNATTSTPPSGAASQPGYTMEQEYQSLYLFNALRNIVLTTSLLPIQAEYIPLTSINPSQNSSNNFSYTLTDFIPDIQYGPDSRSYFVYNPSGPYRLIDMNGNTAIKSVDINIFWLDNIQRLRNVYLKPNEYVSVKLLFIKKSAIINRNEYKL